MRRACDRARPFEWTSGTAVFDGETIVAICSKHLGEMPEPPSRRLGAPVRSQVAPRSVTRRRTSIIVAGSSCEPQGFDPSIAAQIESSFARFQARRGRITERGGLGVELGGVGCRLVVSRPGGFA